MSDSAVIHSNYAVLCVVYPIVAVEVIMTL